MASHPIDFEFQAQVFADPELKAIFAERARLQRWLDFEAALAAAQAEHGVIPAAAAEEIAARARLEDLDLEALRTEYDGSRNSLLPLIKTLRRACRDQAGDYVHFGATTQDVLDTGQVLELRAALAILYRDTRGLEEALIRICREHRNTPIIGRTHGQQALPVTFGFKAAIWLAELRRHIERLKALAPRVLIGQLSGAVGTMAALGPRAREVAAATLARLGLGCPEICWHTARDNMAETAAFFAMLASTLEKIAAEVLHLAAAEVGELREVTPARVMSSSTMPHKSNPVLCQRVAVLARQVRALAGTVMEAMVHEHERDVRALWSEWLAMPQLAIYAGTCLKYAGRIIADLQIFPERMLHNLSLGASGAISEWLLFRLAPELGRAPAQARLHDLFQQNLTSGRDLPELLKSDPVIGPLLNAGDFEQLRHPERYCGQAGEIVDAVLSQVLRQRQEEPETLV